MKTTSDCDFGIYPLMTVVTIVKLSSCQLRQTKTNAFLVTFVDTKVVSTAALVA